MEKKNNKKKIIIIFLIVLLIASAAFAITGYVKKKYNNPTKKQNETKLVDGLTPPDDIDLIEYEKDEKSIGFVNIKCYDKDKNEIDVYTPGSIIMCKPVFSAKEGFNISEIYYTFSVGEGFEYIGPSEYKDSNINTFDVSKLAKKGNTSIKNLDSKITSETATNKLESDLYYQFKIKESSDSNMLEMSISNIIFKTIKKDYYQVKPVTISKSLKATLYYLFKDEYGNIYSFDKETGYSDTVLIGKFQCYTDDCEYKYEHNGNYVLFKDPDYVAYNYVTKERVDLSAYNKYAYISLVADSKLRGLIIGDEDNKSFYSLELKKTIVSSKNYTEYFAKDGYIVIYGQINKIIDYKGNQYIPPKEELTSYKDSNFNCMVVNEYIERDIYYFFDKNGKALFEGEGYADGMILMIDDTSLVLIKDKAFKKYDLEGNIIYSSNKEYKDLHVVDDNLVVVDKNNILKIIDANENVIAELGSVPSDYEMHWMISGNYEYKNKKGLYIIVQSNTVTREELAKDVDDIDDYGDYEDKGYEYYYIPSTGETGRFATFIGGYAKPILYLYPKEDNTNITVRFEKPSLLTTTYPKYKSYWNVKANKNGDLYDINGKYYYGLYWEEEGHTSVDFSEGFYVTKDIAIDFLEEKLSLIGLNDKERNEFIMYWLPILEKNEKNLVYFELTEEREKYNKLLITPKPDTLLRLAIHIKKVNKKIKVKEQKLKTIERNGFTAIEWGGVIHN